MHVMQVINHVIPAMKYGGSVFIHHSLDLLFPVKWHERFDRRRCHEYVCDRFSSTIMAKNYLDLYEKVCNGENLHDQRPSWNDPVESKYLPLTLA